jgi:hypothetical protein
VAAVLVRVEDDEAARVSGEAREEKGVKKLKSQRVKELKSRMVKESRGHKVIE